MEYWAKKKSGIFVIILILIQILIMCFFSAKKEGYHLDEIYSYELSNSTAVNSNYYGAIETNDKFGTDWIFGDEIKSYLVADEWERFAYDSVLTNQEADVHPPLYYLIFHTICSFFPGVFSKWFGLSINIIFFVITDILLYFLSKKLSNNDNVAILSVAIYGFSVGAINTVTFIRMYALLTLWVVLFIYLHLPLRNLSHVEKRQVKAKIPIKVWIPLAIVTILGTLTQYYFLIFAFFFCACWCCDLLLKKQWKFLFQYAVVEVLSVCASIAIFPAMLKHIFSGFRGEAAFEALAENDSWSEYIKEYFSILDYSVGWGILKLFVIAAIIVFLLFLFQKLYMKISIQYNVRKSILEITGSKIAEIKYDVQITSYLTFGFVLLLSTVCYLMLITRIAPYRTDRYIMILFPIIAFLGASVLFKIMHKIAKKKRNVNSSARPTYIDCFLAGGGSQLSLSGL